MYEYLNSTRRYLNILDKELKENIEAYIKDDYWLNGLSSDVINIIERSKIDLEQYFITPV